MPRSRPRDRSARAGGSVSSSPARLPSWPPAGSCSTGDAVRLTLRSLRNRRACGRRNPPRRRPERPRRRRSPPSPPTPRRPDRRPRCRILVPRIGSRGRR
ncbi:hypothetical protein Z045_14020 [Rhodococcus pyridinivorans KG-16]|uniref:Uncharacterized protein n=1 Tax=Rhodococcus pyridinivorans KG-16 TaxID=1441730 RepID=A0A0V9UJW1_9NOCA|nr:hypothetical protein Z045_14020 [Rhodococcus pyridinivorans KG-16]